MWKPPAPSVARFGTLCLRHLFPNSIHGLIALITLDVGATVVLVTSFTFIGLIGRHRRDDHGS